jgi:sulfoxide reductase heme-binding subunit YedZ
MLHRLIYISAICGVIHYYWLVKSAVLRPLTYGAIVAILLLWRLGNWFIRRGRAVTGGAKTQSASANT